MSKFTGLFELRTPADLVRKLHHDLKRMESSPQDQFAAFDFFTTADCVVDWLHPDRRVFRDNAVARKALRDSSALLRITSHLANGSKHFHATVHNSVTETEKFRCFEEGVFEEGCFHEPLLIHLTLHEAQELGYPTTAVEAIILAKGILEFWNKHVLKA